MANKVVILGRAAVGKTSLIEAVFGGVDCDDLLNNPPEPTRGVVSSVSKWIDLELGLFDTSGQELTDFLNDHDRKEQILRESSVIIYMVDYQRWVSERNEIVQEIRIIYKDVKKLGGITKFHIFFNKIDQIGYEIDGIFDLIDKNIHLRLAIPGKIDIYYTSIKRELLFSSFNAFATILTPFSKRMSEIKTFIDKAIESKSNTICFITSQTDDKIVLISVSKDFQVGVILYLLYKRIASMSRAKKVHEQKIYRVGTKNYKRVISELNGKDLDLKRMILLSEVVDKKELKEIVKRIRFRFNI